jgi:hypothetical protein
VTSLGRGVIVGNPEPTHVGAHLLSAARSLGVPVDLADVRLAHRESLPSRIRWRLGNHRPNRLREFSRHVVDVCSRRRARWLLSTGIAPLDVDTLGELRGNGVRLMNFLTDDPWNPTHRADWFLEALPSYDCVFSPRRANLGDLRALGCRHVSYCAFAYAPDVHYPAAPDPGTPRDVDVLFVGGADPDRLPYVHALAAAGFSMALYGGYWDRDRIARPFHRGFADAAGVRAATSSATVSLCLVRRANRDGHAMRSFEIPAMAGCMVAEDTEDHRSLLGPDGEAALYFTDEADMVERVVEVRRDSRKRDVMAQTAHRVMTDGRHTYADRLTQMLQAEGLPPAGVGANPGDSALAERRIE